MRSSFRDKDYLTLFVDERMNSVSRRIAKLDSGKIHTDRVLAVKQAIASTYLHIVIARYTKGEDLETLQPELFAAINYMNQSLINNQGKVHVFNDEYKDQYYLHVYQELLQALSLSVLLNIPEANKNTLVSIIERDNIQDLLFEFVSKAHNRPDELVETYDISESHIVLIYKKLREAVKASDPSQSEKLIKEYLVNDYYNPNLNLYESHQSEANIYCGYWSFEAAVIVAIKNLDDSSFRDNPYYPKDLVDYYRSTTK